MSDDRPPTLGEWDQYRQYQNRNFARGILIFLAVLFGSPVLLAIFIWLTSGIDLNAI